MTARSSTGNFSKFGTYFLYKLRNLRPLIILNSIFALLSYPFVGGILVPFAANQAAIENYRNEFYGDNLSYVGDIYSEPAYQTLVDQQGVLEGLLIMSIVIGIIMLVALFIMSNTMVIKNFRWLYSKTVVDMDYSLPVSDDTRFFGDLLASFAGSLVPHLIAILTGSVLWRVALNILANDLISPEDIEEYKEILGCLIPEQLMYTGLFACIMFMAFTLFVMSVCGRRAETGIYSYVLTGAVTIIHVICLLIVMTNVYGLDYYGLEMRDLFAVSATSPLGLIFVTLYYLFDASGEISEFLVPLFRPATGIAAVLITVALFVLAYFLIRKRRAERVGSPFTFGIVKAVIPAVVTFAVVAPFMWVIFGAMRDAKEYSYEPEMTGIVVAMFIITLVLYIIMELISGKGFRKFHITLLKYVITMAVSLAVCFCLYASNGFGIANYVPDAEDVQSAHVYIRGSSNGYGLDASVEEEDSIKALIEIHEEIPKKPVEDIQRTNPCAIGIEYYLKDGTDVHRYYYITEEQYLDYLKRATTPEAFCNSEFRNRDKQYGDRIKKVLVSNGSLVSTSYEVDISYKEFCEAYRKDCDSVTFEKAYCLGEDMYFTTVELEYTRRYEYEMDRISTQSITLNVYSWMENTIALFAKNGIQEIEYKDMSGFRSAFLIAYDKNNYGIYSNADVAAAFMMTGDNTLTDKQRVYYGYPAGYVYVGDFEEEPSVYEYDVDKEITVEYYRDSVQVVDYQAVRIDMDDPALGILLDGTSAYASPLYDSEKIYSVLMVGTEDLSGWLDAESEFGYASAEYFITFDNYDLAAEKMAAN
ncbi:MAG: hypothetical protein IJZ47_02605 [Oscillospiraceae bacterium]|nr:hypothetical protein [Oscillospiraceae bacterium]